jgi:hypothetical protein
VLFSSYVDDIAFEKILMSAVPDVACTATRTGYLCFGSYLRRCGLFITSDWVFLVGWGLLLR